MKFNNKIMVVVITMTNSQAAFQHIEKLLILTCIYYKQFL